MPELFDLNAFSTPLPVPQDIEQQDEAEWLARQPFIADTPTERAVFRGGPYDGTEQIVTRTLSEVIVDGSMTLEALRTGRSDWAGHYVYRRTTKSLVVPADPHYIPKMSVFEYVGPTENLTDDPADMADPVIPAEEFPTVWDDDDE